MGLSGGGLEGLTTQPASLTGLGIWKYRTEIAAPPASGQVRFNNADPSIATEMYIHETNQNGLDLANIFALIEANTLLYLQDRQNSDNFFVISVTSNTDSGAYRTIVMATIILQGVEPSQNQDMALVVA